MWVFIRHRQIDIDISRWNLVGVSAGLIDAEILDMQGSTPALNISLPWCHWPPPDISPCLLHSARGIANFRTNHILRNTLVSSVGDAAHCSLLTVDTALILWLPVQPGDLAWEASPPSPPCQPPPATSSDRQVTIIGSPLCNEANRHQQQQFSHHAHLRDLWPWPFPALPRQAMPVSSAIVVKVCYGSDDNIAWNRHSSLHRFPCALAQKTSTKSLQVSTK